MALFAQKNLQKSPILLRAVSWALNLKGIVMTLTELEVLASEKLANNDEESRADFLRLLNAGLLITVIDNLSGSQRELEDVACRSYCHNNGFLKILLVDKRPKYSIRLHIWPQHSFQECDVHNHPWDMSGLVLNGSYEWPIYSFGQTQEKRKCVDMYECRYLEDYSGHSFHKQGKVLLKQVDTLSFQRGDIFQLPQRRYHSVRKENAEHAESIVITGDSEVLSADIITNREMSCNSVLNNTPLDSSFLKEKLVSFIGRR
ncbi:MAG: hypothetical protein ACI9DG_001513 [Oleispira sp.]